MKSVRGRQIIAVGGGGFTMDPPEIPFMDDYIIAASGVASPKICFLPTASGDSDNYIVKFYASFAPRICRPSHLSLFNRRSAAVTKSLLDQDIVYVGGGNVANMCALWHLHGVSDLLVQAYHAGILMCGMSAGAMCWFTGGVTDSFGSNFAAWNEGLGLISALFCPHYDSEAGRVPVFERMVAEHQKIGYGVEDGVAIRFVNEEVVDCVASKNHARGLVVEPGNGGIATHSMDVRCLAADETR